MKLTHLLLFSAFSAFPANAQMADFQSMVYAQELGSLIASEGMCGLSFDQTAIEAWIDENIDPSNMGFASELAMMTDGARFQIQSLTESGGTAHCTAITRSARHFGFID